MDRNKKSRVGGTIISLLCRILIYNLAHQGIITEQLAKS